MSSELRKENDALLKRVEALEELLGVKSAVPEIPEALSEILWEPSLGDYGWKLQTDGEKTLAHTLIPHTQKQGNLFPTKEAADRASHKRRAYRKLVRDIAVLNDGWWPDWQASSYKYPLVFNVSLNKWNTCSFKGMQMLPSCLYFKNRTTALDYIDRVGPEFLKTALL